MTCLQYALKHPTSDGILEQQVKLLNQECTRLRSMLLTFGYHAEVSSPPFGIWCIVHTIA